MKTYKDIYAAIMNGKIIITTNRFGSTVKYFKDNKGVARSQFNNCKPDLFMGLDTIIDDFEIVNIEIL